MSKKSPFTKIEVIEERHPNQSADVPLVKVTDVLVNGQKVRVAKDGIYIDYGEDNGEGKDVVTVNLELQVDEFLIHQVPHGYTENKASTSSGPHLQWTVGVDMEDGKGTPITTKIDPPRDHLGRFTKRK